MHAEVVDLWVVVVFVGEVVGEAVGDEVAEIDGEVDGVAVPDHLGRLAGRGEGFFGEREVLLEAPDGDGLVGVFLVVGGDVGDELAVPGFEEVPFARGVDAFEPDDVAGEDDDSEGDVTGGGEVEYFVEIFEALRADCAAGAEAALVDAEAGDAEATDEVAGVGLPFGEGEAAGGTGEEAFGSVLADVAGVEISQGLEGLVGGGHAEQAGDVVFEGIDLGVEEGLGEIVLGVAIGVEIFEIGAEIELAEVGVLQGEAGGLEEFFHVGAGEAAVVDVVVIPGGDGGSETAVGAGTAEEHDVPGGAADGFGFGDARAEGRFKDDFVAPGEDAIDLGGIDDEIEEGDGGEERERDQEQEAQVASVGGAGGETGHQN